MSNKIAMLLIGAWYLATPELGASRAQAEEPSASSQRGDLTSYDFEDDLVLGDLVREEAKMLFVRRRGLRESLIQVRTQYIPELLKSADDL